VSTAGHKPFIAAHARPAQCSADPQFVQLQISGGKLRTLETRIVTPE